MQAARYPDIRNMQAAAAQWFEDSDICFRRAPLWEMLPGLRSGAKFKLLIQALLNNGLADLAQKMPRTRSETAAWMILQVS